MKALFQSIVFFLLIGLMSCEEEGVEVSGLNHPQLEARGVQADRFSFAVTIEEDGVNGQLYFLVQTSDQPPMTAKAIRNTQWATSFDLNGADFRTASMPGLQSQTEYTLYAIVVVGEQLSRVATLNVTTL